MNDQQSEVFEQKMDKWLEEHIYKGDGGLRFRRYVEAYVELNCAGRVSDSVFEIVERAMVEAGELRPIVFDDKSSEIEKKIADFEAGKIPVYNFRLACKADRELRDAYERFTGLAQLASGR